MHKIPLYSMFTTRVAGVTFDDRQQILSDIRGTGVDIFIQPDTDNKYDPNAIEVLTEDSKSLGYVPRKLASELKGQVGGKIKCKNWTVYGGGSNRNYGISITF